MVAQAEIFCSISLDILLRKSADFKIYRYVMLKGHVYLIWQTLPYLAMKDSRKSPSPMLCQWGYRDIVQVLAISSAQVPAGRRINFEGLAFASKAILRQNTLDPAICRLCLSFSLNNSNILEKGLIIPLRVNN